MDDNVLAIRRRLRDDFEFYAQHALKIRTKAGEIVPFRLNRAQRHLLDVIIRQLETTGKIRIIILKARQLGLSTLIGAFLFFRVSQAQAKKAIVVTHQADTTRALFDMTKRFYSLVPEILRPHAEYSSRKELKFDALDSGYTVATAGGDGVGRGETFTHAHLSEVPFWPKATAIANYTGLMQAIPDAPDTAIFIESTAQGMVGIFPDVWNAAVKGENEYEAVFLPWFFADEYRVVPPANFERSPEEHKIAELALETYGMTLEDAQFQFRRRKIVEIGPDKWCEEYPSTAEEAFLTSGRPVFFPPAVQKLLENAKKPIARLALEGKEWLPHPRGELACYLPHDPAETYFIGADVGLGVQRDWSVAQVFNSKKEQAAVFRAQIAPDYYSTALHELAKFFNDAKLIVESNNHGLLVCTRIATDFNYVNFYQDVVYDKVTDTETQRLGFQTNVRTKPMIIDKLRTEVREGTTKLYDETTIRELRSYIVTETGSMEAEKGSFDDCVMSLALVNHINEGTFEPIENLDSWFFKME